jgi:ABC-type nitrate/sulfonate/bicarbonate transport system permease component
MGLLAGIARPVERFYEPIISLTYPVPKIVVLPVLIAWLGAGDASKIAIITAAVFYPTFINALYGAKAVDRLLVWSGRNMGATPVQVFLKIILPSALPQVLVGLRIALALAFIVVVASEMANSRTGLGHLIITAEDNIRFDLMYAAIVAVALIGFSGDRLLAMIRRRALLGRDAAREA